MLQQTRIGEQEVADTLRKLDPVWDELFPVEKARIVELLVEKVIVGTSGMEVKLRGDGLFALVSELSF